MIIAIKFDSSNFNLLDVEKAVRVLKDNILLDTEEGTI